jgi:DNA (cytosine-5)-methyltransferase 1
MSLIYRRIHPLKPSYTVVAYGGGGTWGYHYASKRGMLTNRERARIQTFPDAFYFKGSWSQVRAQIGEAVPPLMAKRIAEAVASILMEVS